MYVFFSHEEQLSDRNREYFTSIFVSGVVIQEDWSDDVCTCFKCWGVPAKIEPHYFSFQMIIWGGPCKVLTVSRDKGSDLWVDYSAIES